MTPEKSWLTLAELQEITGYKTKKKIIAWLKANYIHHLVNGLGMPLVSRAYLNCRMAGVEYVAPTQQAANAPTLNIGNLRTIGKKAA